MKKRPWERKYAIARSIGRGMVCRVARKRYGFKVPKIELPDGPCLVLCNHVTTYEPLLVVAACKKPLHAVIAKDFIRFHWRKALQFWFSPIWKDKSLQDASVPLAIIRAVRAGDSVLLFPEGNRTFSSRLCYISDATAKLIRSCKANVVYLNVTGGFSIDPRFSLDFRKGSMNIALRGILKKEDIAKMSVPEIKANIIENLTVNDVPSKEPSLSDKRAEKLERALYRCPICHSLNHIRSEGNLVKCDSCGLEVTYGERLTFENPNKEDFPHRELYDWFVEQEEYVRSTSFSPEDLIYEENDVDLEDIDLNHQTILMEHVPIRMFGSKLQIGEQEFPFEEIAEIAVSGKQTFLFYSEGITYRVSSSIVGWNPLKYMQMFYHIRNKNNGQDDSFLGI